MRNNLLALLAIFSFCLPLIATDNMCLRFKDGKIITYSVGDLEEVFFVENIENPVVGDSSSIIDASQVPLSFEVLSNSSVIVKSVNSKSIRSIDIPAKVRIDGKEYNVIGIGDYAFFGCEKLESVEIPLSVTTISYAAFSHCVGLIDINVPESVAVIENYAFDGCSKLNVVIYNTKDNVRTQNNAFLGCKSVVYSKDIPFVDPTTLLNFRIISDSTVEVIKSESYKSLELITIPEKVEIGDKMYTVTSIGDTSFYLCEKLLRVEIPKTVTRIGAWAFVWCSSLTRIEIPASVTKIENNAFAWCQGLTHVTIPSSITVISDHVFSDCMGLRSVEIPSSVTSIENSAFYECRHLSDVNIPSSVTSIGKQSFMYCDDLTKVKIPESVTYIGYAAFNDCNLLDVEIDNYQENVEVENWAFRACKSVRYKEKEIPSPLKFNILSDSTVEFVKNSYYEYMDSISVPGKTIIDGKEYKVVSIGNSAFSFCQRLVSVTIPSSVTNIGDYAFSNCTSLKNVTLPSEVTSIGESAFWRCYRLERVTIPDGVTNINPQTFLECTNLTYIDIPSGVTSIGSYAFKECMSLTSIYIPSGVISIGAEAFSGCVGLNEINIDVNNTMFSSINGVLYDKSETEILCVPCGVTDEFVIPTSVTSIGVGAFSGCVNLRNVVIPESVSSIGERAFYGCKSLDNIEIPSGVTVIDDETFRGCGFMSNLTIPSSISRIGNSAFAECFAMSSLDLPLGVNEIGSNAFQGCSSLTFVRIPSSVYLIDTYAFSECYNLEVEIENSRNSVQINEGALADCWYISFAR